MNANLEFRIAMQEVFTQVRIARDALISAHVMTLAGVKRLGGTDLSEALEGVSIRSRELADEVDCLLVALPIEGI